MFIGNPQKAPRIVGSGPLCSFAVAALLPVLAATAVACGGSDEAEIVAVAGSGGIAGSDGQAGAEAAAGSGGQAGVDASDGSGGQAGDDSSAGGGGAGGSGGSTAGGDGQAGADVSTGGTAGQDAGDAGEDTSVDGAADGNADGQDSCGCSCQVEACNGVDDNCNGQTDESDPRFGQDCTSSNLGACAAGKFTRCSAGQIVCTPQVEAGTQVETCNNIDDDCDGVVDNNMTDARLGVDCAVSGKSGECAKGKVICVTGNAVCGQIILPTTETCNGKDDDCDGVVDNPAAVTGASCNTGLLGQCAPGTTTCGDGGPGCVQVNASIAEICNGLDDNCDGTADNVTGSTNSCATDNPSAQHVTSWGCSAGSTCSIPVGGCEAGWNNVDTLVTNGCECNATDYTAASCVPTSIVFATNLTSETKTVTGIISAMNGDAWFDVEFRNYAVTTTSATGVYRSIEMTNTGDGGYTIEYGKPGTTMADCLVTVGCPLAGASTSTGTGATKWELNLTHNGDCAAYGHCTDNTTSIPKIIRVHVRRTASPACSPFTITAINTLAKP
jgi:hypothetical protein